MCCMNTTIAADRNNFKVTFQVAFWGPIRPNFEYDHVAFREVRYLTDGVLPIFMSFAAIQSGFMLLFQGLVTCWNLTQTGPPRLYSFRTVQYSSCNFQVFFLPAFLDTDLPRGNGHERDSKIPCKVPSLPNPATREGWPHHQGQPPLLFSNSNVGSFTSHKNRTVKVLWDGTYGFSSLSEKTRTSNHLKLSLQRQHFLLGYLRSVFPARVWTRDLPLRRPALSQLS